MNGSFVDVKMESSVGRLGSVLSEVKQVWVISVAGDRPASRLSTFNERKSSLPMRLTHSLILCRPTLYLSVTHTVIVVTNWLSGRASSTVNCIRQRWFAGRPSQVEPLITYNGPSGLGAACIVRQAGGGAGGLAGGAGGTDGGGSGDGGGDGGDGGGFGA